MVCTLLMLGNSIDGIMNCMYNAQQDAEIKGNAFM
jgi:hypothetical protein